MLLWSFSSEDVSAPLGAWIWFYFEFYFLNFVCHHKTLLRAPIHTVRVEYVLEDGTVSESTTYWIYGADCAYR